MREARRVDLRNGVNIKQKIEEEEEKWRNHEVVDRLKQSLGIIFIFLFSSSYYLFF